MLPQIKIESVPEQLRRLTDEDLVANIQMLTRGERRMTIGVLHHLNEIEHRRLFLELGYGSLFDYCVRKLKYSASAAGRRIQAARCIRHHPEVLGLLGNRDLSLSTIALIQPILTDANKKSILDRVRGASHRDVERVVAEYRPPGRFRDRVRPVRVATSTPVDIDAELFERECARNSPAGWSHRIRTEPKLFVQFLASEELMQKFEEARSLLSHRCTDHSFAEVLDLLLTDFIERHGPATRIQRRDKRKGATSPDSRRRECNESQPRSRYISTEVRDEVFIRDGGRCSYAARDGTKCGSQRSLQVDHIWPFALGGTNDMSNLRLLCGAHNRLAAEKALGERVMQQFWPRE